MLKAHFDAVENQLLQTSRIPANAGHTLHRGTPREAFIRQFLEGHISTRVSIGTGEIIDASSTPRQPRNQFDIVVYRSDFPRIDLGGGINAFLAESVVATIEVKSRLTENELHTSILNAHRAKSLRRNLVMSFSTGYIPPGILSFVVAYSGPSNIDTVYTWLKRIEVANRLNTCALPATAKERLKIRSESVEAIHCLGLGSIIFDNSPLSILTDQVRRQDPQLRYTVLDQSSGNILWLFLLLTEAVAGVHGQRVNLVPYLRRVQMPARFAR